MTNKTNETTKIIVRGKLLLTPSGDKNWIVQETIMIETGTRTFSIPKGMITDLASVPRALWIALPPFGEYTIAAVVHDRIYRAPELNITRAEADQLFYDLMVQYGVSTVKAKAMYYGVRSFGAWSYKDRV
ncbi:DUF1353 domain-containing protein [Aeromonas sobria]|uniref:DUF1353 domain-containing protein n=1 Tax=Aeromonas sobria TaxID=646 RepID=UPI000C6E44C1|nr:DUF1353 domain-containing protein [Aeromonas sobria]PKQ78079.1 hypothetical protein CJF47_07305 [Aeromonas sobria]